MDRKQGRRRARPSPATRMISRLPPSYMRSGSISWPGSRPWKTFGLGWARRLAKLPLQAGHHWPTAA
jgi:hypothetical protein